MNLESETIINIDEDINVLMKNYKKNKKKYKTNQSLTKYEKTRIISERATQISNGSPLLIENGDKYTNAYDIALAELERKVLPFIVKRPYGNTYEYWKLKDLL